MKYILFYEVYYGGEFTKEFERFESEEQLHERVSELISKNGENISIECAGNLSTEFEYETIKYAVKVQHKIKK